MTDYTNTEQRRQYYKIYYQKHKTKLQNRSYNRYHTMKEVYETYNKELNEKKYN